VLGETLEAAGGRLLYEMYDLPLATLTEMFLQQRDWRVMDN
jgi:hypothetical protein